jgi:hypothetical protein
MTFIKVCEVSGLSFLRGGPHGCGSLRLSQGQAGGGDPNRTRGNELQKPES